jgi:hypothetical protein
LLLQFATPAAAAAALSAVITVNFADSVCFFFMYFTLSAASLMVTSSGSSSAYCPGTVRLMLLLVHANWMSDADDKPAKHHKHQPNSVTAAVRA